MIQSLFDRKIEKKTDEQQRRPDSFDDQRVAKNSFNDQVKITAWGVHESGLSDFAPLEGNSAAHQSKQNDGKSDNAQAAHLKKNQSNQLADEGKVFADINGGKACDADGRRGSKKRVGEAQALPAGGTRKPQRQRAQQNEQGKAYCKNSCRCEMAREKRFKDQIEFHRRPS